MSQNIYLVPDPAPESPDPGFHAINSGDNSDDDGQAIDDYFRPAFNGPVQSETYDLGVEETRKTTRILSNRTSMPASGDPVQVLPADSNRLHLRVICDQVIAISSDKTDLYGAAQLPANTAWSNDYHNGAVWVWQPSGTACAVNTWAVTE